MKRLLIVCLLLNALSNQAQESIRSAQSKLGAFDPATLSFESKLDKSNEKTELEGPNLTRNLGQKSLIKAIQFSPDNKFIVTADADRMVKFWDASSGRFLRGQLAPYDINCLSISSDGKTYATAGGQSAETGEYLITLWDIQTGKKIKDFKGHQGKINDVEIHKIGKLMASVGEDEKLRIWDIDQGSQKESHYLHFEAQSLGFNPTGFWVILSGQSSEIQVWNLMNGAIFRKLGKDEHHGTIPSMDLSPNGRNVVGGIGPFMGKWDFVLGTFLGGMEWSKKLKDRPNAHQMPINKVAYNPYGNYVYSSSEKKIVIWDELTMQPLVNMTGHQSKIVNFALSSDGYFLVSCAEDGSFILWDAISGKQRWSSKSYFMKNNEVSLTHDGKGIVTSNNGENIHFWNLETLTKHSKSVLQKSLDPEKHYDFRWEDDKLMLLSYAQSPPIWTLDLGEKIEAVAATMEGQSIYVKLPNRFVVIDPYEGIMKEEFSAPKTVSQLALHQNGKLLFAMGDGVDIWDITNKNVIATLHDIEGDEEYFVNTPDGYYMSTKKGLDQVHFVDNLDFYTFDQFDLQFNRPDIIYARMGLISKERIAAYKKAWEKRVKKMGFSPADFEGERKFEAPQLKLLDVEPFWEVNRPSYSFDFETTDLGCKLDRMIVEVNGVPYFGSRGFEIPAVDSCRYSGSLEIAMSSGINKIDVSVMNERGVESVIDKLEVTYDPPEPVVPDLHVIVIGVSKFQESDYNLTYADKDAQDIAAQFELAKGFGQKKIYRLTNEKATVANILSLRSELEKTRVDDEVVVFVASHGLLDDEFNYYIAMHDTHFNDPKIGGLPYDQLESLLDRIPARNKLMLLDACHSGEVDKEETTVTASANNVINGTVKFRGFKTVETKSSGVGLASSFELMKELFADLRRNNGAVVISSASGKEFAFESEEWQNGVFTYSLLEGLRSGHADSNQDQIISVSEVRDYVGKRVVELTDGKQNPTSRTENLESDFKVW